MVATLVFEISACKGRVRSSRTSSANISELRCVASVAVAPQIVILLVRVQLPCDTPKFIMVFVR
jgi:hypothetical protein